MMILVTPAWPSQLWYPETMRMSIQLPILLTWRRDLLKNPKGEIHPLVQNKTFKVSGTASLRARSQKEGVTRKASNLIIKSKRSRSNSNHESAWGKRAGWCAERKIDRFCSNTNQILKILSLLFQNGLQYRTINNYRSEISAFHDQIQVKPVEEHPRICYLVLVFLIVDLHNQGTVLFGISRQ